MCQYRIISENKDDNLFGSESSRQLESMAEMETRSEMGTITEMEVNTEMNQDDTNDSSINGSIALEFMMLLVWVSFLSVVVPFVIHTLYPGPQAKPDITQVMKAHLDRKRWNRGPNGRLRAFQSAL